MVCYSHIAVGPHTFRAAMGDQTIAETSATIHENAQGPAWTVCNSDNGVCPVAAVGGRARANSAAINVIPARPIAVRREQLRLSHARKRG